MAVASLILGILSICIAWLPVIGVVAIIPCILSFVFALVSISKKGSQKAMSITGLVLSIISFLIMIFWVFIFIMAICFDDGYEDSLSNYWNSYDYIDEYEDDLHSTYSMSEDIKLNDRVIKVQKVERSQGNENYKPSEGNDFLLVTISMKNISMHDIIYTCDDFELVDDNKKSYQTDYNKIHSNTTFAKDSLGKNSVKTGVLCFEVKKDSKNFTLQYKNITEHVNITLK